MEASASLRAHGEGEAPSFQRRPRPLVSGGGDDGPEPLFGEENAEGLTIVDAARRGGADLGRRGTTINTPVSILAAAAAAGESAAATAGRPGLL